MCFAQTLTRFGKKTSPNINIVTYKFEMIQKKHQIRKTFIRKFCGFVVLYTFAVSLPTPCHLQHNVGHNQCKSIIKA